MPNLLKKWFGKKKKETPGPMPPPLMPTLPVPRPRPLTAISSPSPASATQNSLLFERLPPDIRRCILIEAFGGRTMHLALEAQSPRTNDPNYYPDYNYNTSERWLWAGGVCQRDASPPYLDSCFKSGRRDRAVEVTFSVGAMGWLLSCRQAYVEGIDVLYGTNTMHMAGDSFADQLHKIIVPGRLASIKSVELIWRFEYSQRDRTEDYYQSIRRLPEIFPNLTSLHLAIQGYMLPPRDPAKPFTPDSLAEGGIVYLRAVDCIVKQFNRLVDCHVYLPSPFFELLKWKEHGGRCAPRTKSEPAMVWRGLPDNEPPADHPLLESTRAIKGYWVHTGVDEYPGVILFGSVLVAADST